MVKRILYNDGENMLAVTDDCEISDTIQEALIGLVTAVDKYDPDSSGPFGSYASLWILQNIGRAQATQRPAVYYPVHKKEGYFTMYPILKENGYLNFDIWTDPEVRRIIQDRLGCGIDQAEDIIRQSMPIESLDEIYEMFLKNIDVDEIQDDVFENIIENEIQPNVFQNINPDVKQYFFSGINSLCVSVCDILILFILGIQPFFFIFQCFLRLVPSGI